MKVSKLLLLTGFIAVVATSSPRQSEAQVDTTSTIPNKTITLGIEEGPGFLLGNGGTHLQWGGQALYQLPILPFQIGGYIEYMSRGSLSDPVTGNQVDGNYLFYGGQVLYNMDNWLQNATLGARIGLVHNSTTNNLVTGGSVENNTTNFSIGPIFTYDVPLSSSWSVGGLANFLIQTGSAHDDFALLLTLKYYL